MSTTFHPGELAVQRRMGQANIAERVGRSIHSQIPAQAANFLADQPMIVLAATDEAGRMWTSLIAGPPGFARAVDTRTIEVDALPVAGDPLARALVSPRHVGLIALQPHTRRRMRVNGTATAQGCGLRIQTDQVYSKLPEVHLAPPCRGGARRPRAVVRAPRCCAR